MTEACATADLAALAAAQGCEALDLRFTDVLGRWLGVSLRAAQLRAEDGPVRVSAATIAGWRRAGIADLALVPVPGTAFRAAPAPVPTLAAIAQVHEPGAAEGAPSRLDPRATLARALVRLAARGVADELRVGVELEFHLFESVRYQISATACGFSVLAWDAGRDGTHAGHGVDDAGRHLALPPADVAASWRAELAAAAERIGLEPLKHQHEAGAGQHELVLRHAPALRAADRIQIAKALVLAAAARDGRTATFMPLPLVQGPGSGLHLNLSFWRGGSPVLAGPDGERLARGFVGGVFAHARALNALTNPATNSFKRLARLYAPSAKLTWGIAGRGAAIRLPRAALPGAARLEFRFPDAGFRAQPRRGGGGARRRPRLPSGRRRLRRRAVRRAGDGTRRGRAARLRAAAPARIPSLSRRMSPRRGARHAPRHSGKSRCGSIPHPAMNFRTCATSSLPR
jgi:glutamine synthetase